MEYQINDSITIWQKDVLTFDMNGWNYDAYLNRDPFGPKMRICIRGRWFDVIPLGAAYRTRNEDDYFRFIYIQINYVTGEFYVGKVNRNRLSEFKKYRGSGLKFKAKYQKHADEFTMYYIAHCETARETERLEAEIVNKELLEDPFCLNLHAGGGGTSEHISKEERSRKQREYMKTHPERYEAMRRAYDELYRSGDTSAKRRRNEKTKETMSTQEYRDMSRDRHYRWKAENPEAYAASRENNKKAVGKKEVQEKRVKTLKAEWKKNPEKRRQRTDNFIAAVHTPEAEAKRSEKLKKWNVENPESVKRRAEKSAEKCRKPVNMLDLKTGAILKTFTSQQEAAEWLVDNGLAKNTNCKASISSVCLKKPCTTGYGYRKKAYGYGWEFTDLV